MSSMRMTMAFRPVSQSSSKQPASVVAANVPNPPLMNARRGIPPPSLIGAH